MTRWFLGTDLALEEDGDLSVVDGDLVEMTGQTCLHQNLLDRLSCAPGGLLWHPTFGAGVQDLVGRVMGHGDYEEVEAMVRLALLEDPRVAEVVEVRVERVYSGMTDGIDGQEWKERPWQQWLGELPQVVARATVRTQDGQVVGNLVFPFDTGSSL